MWPNATKLNIHSESYLRKEEEEEEGEELCSLVKRCKIWKNQTALFSYVNMCGMLMQGALAWEWIENGSWFVICSKPNSFVQYAHITMLFVSLSFELLLRFSCDNFGFTPFIGGSHILLHSFCLILIICLCLQYENNICENVH